MAEAPTPQPPTRTASGVSTSDHGRILDWRIASQLGRVVLPKRRTTTPLRFTLSASIPLIELKSLIHDAFPGQDEAHVWLRDRCGLSDEASSGAVEEALVCLSAQPGDVVLERLLGAAPFMVDRARILAVSLGLTLPGSALDEADFAMRRGVSVLVNLLAGGDYALAYRFFHRCFAWGAKAADVEPGHALASLDRLTDNLLQLGVHKQEELFKVLLAEHPGHAEEIHRLARLMGHFTLAPPPPPLPTPIKPSLAERLLSMLHQARLKIVAWRRPSRLALVLVPCMAIFLVFLTASTPPKLAQAKIVDEAESVRDRIDALLAIVEGQARMLWEKDNDNRRLKEELDEVIQENIALAQKDTVTQAELQNAKAVTLDQAKTIESLRRKNQALLSTNQQLTAPATAEEPPVTVSPDPQATPLPPTP